MCRRPSFAWSSAVLHDLAGDAVDLDVHLQRIDAVVGTGDLEVHVAEVILVTEDVGQHGELVAFLDQAHRDTGDRRLDRHAGVHQREAGAADRRHRARAVGLGDLGDDADDVRELVHVRHDRLDAALGQLAVADLAALRRADTTGLADAERREVVVQHERLFALALDRVDDLRVAPVPSVVTTMAWVSPRVNSAEPCVRGSTPVPSTSIGRTVVLVAAVDARLAGETRLRTMFFSSLPSAPRTSSADQRSSSPRRQRLDGCVSLDFADGGLALLLVG